MLCFSFKGRIYGASLLHSHLEIVFLVKPTPTTAQFVHTSYAHPKRPVEALSLEFAVEDEEAVAFIQLQSGIESLLVWDSKRIFYSISAGNLLFGILQ